jgi:hypothetical protein
MSDRRAGFAGGLLWALLSIGAGILLPAPPGADADAPTVLAYFAGNQTHVVIASTLSAIAALALVPFFASLAGRMEDAWASDLARMAGSVVVATGLLGGVVQAGLARSASSLGASPALLSTFIVDRAIFFIAPPLAVSVVLAAAFIGLRRPVAPRWVGILAGVIALVALVGGTAGVISATKAFTTVGFGGFILTIVWVGTASIALAWRPRREGLTLQDASATARPATVHTGRQN